MTPLRRRMVLSAPTLLIGHSALTSCDSTTKSESYETVAEQTWRADSLAKIEGNAISTELVRYATLAPSSHNTQCWKFQIDNKAISILPDLVRRCPAVDPDDHHLFVSLGCAAENLIQAAPAHGLSAEANFDPERNGIRIALAEATTEASALFKAIPSRQCTRGDYDGKALSTQELEILQRAATTNNVRVLLLTERSEMMRVLDFIIQSNTAQMADPVFVKELKNWIRFNGAAAVRTQDGLFSLCSGNPEIPTWLGELAFGLLFRPKSENEKLSKQIRSSAGIAIFVGKTADKSNWIEVGRSYERFALQATALGIRNAFLNQPVEVSAIRSSFAQAFGLANQRPDLVVRFGRGPSLPQSLRRPVQAVLV